MNRLYRNMNLLVAALLASLTAGCAEKIAEDNNLLLMYQLLNTSVVQITESDGSTLLSEAGGSDTINIKLKRQPGADVTVSLYNDSQISLSTATLTFTSTDWNTDQTVTVSAVDDTELENNHTGEIVISASSNDSNFSGTQGQLQITITDDDYACSGKRIFVTATAYNGNLGGTTGADAKCNADAAKPEIGSNTYKALLVNNTRTASTTANAGDGQADWVLAASTTYYRSDCSVAIFNTDANGIFNLGTGTLDNAIMNYDLEYWTGMNTDWTTGAMNRRCNDWASSSSTPRGNLGRANQTGTDAISFGNQRCNQSRYLLCVEQ